MTRRILILYYSYTKQTLRVAEAMAEVFRDRGWNVELCGIEFVDSRFDLNFPLRPFWGKMFKLLLPQLWGRTGRIRLDENVIARDYDLICIGSPTWWLFPALPVTSFLKSEAAGRLLRSRPFAVFAVCRAFWGANLRQVRRLAERAGGRFIGGGGFVFRGNQVRSMLSFINYLQHGADRERFWGCRIYPFGVPAEGLNQAKSFASELLAGLSVEQQSAKELK